MILLSKTKVGVSLRLVWLLDLWIIELSYKVISSGLHSTFQSKFRPVEESSENILEGAVAEICAPSCNWLYISALSNRSIMSCVCKAVWVFGFSIHGTKLEMAPADVLLWNAVQKKAWTASWWVRRNREGKQFMNAEDVKSEKTTVSEVKFKALDYVRAVPMYLGNLRVKCFQNFCLWLYNSLSTTRSNSRRSVWRYESCGCWGSCKGASWVTKVTKSCYRLPLTSVVTENIWF